MQVPRRELDFEILEDEQMHDAVGHYDRYTAPPDGQTGANPIPIIIPCHRVIGSNGKLTGYGGGLPIKEKLLALERRQLRLL